MEKTAQRIRIGLTCGDVNGIGPEVIEKALRHPGFPEEVEWVVIGPVQAVESHGSWRIPLDEPVSPGKLSRAASVAALAAIERAVDGCLSGALDAMVTAPVSKEGLALAGCPWPGHTELIAARTGTRRFGMMLMGGGLRVMLATRHAPLRAVPEMLTTGAVLETIELTDEALRWFGVGERRIAVCGFNPHAGDGGALGDEEDRIILPAIYSAQARGIAASGPLAADAVFYEALQGRYDAVVAMYHDQGLGPLKTVAFACGVNLTVGLPIVRTSPDHGTAFSLAGKGQADAGSLIAAMETALELARRPNPWRGDAGGNPC